jgi:hypothetical protein
MFNLTLLATSLLSGTATTTASLINQDSPYKNGASITSRDVFGKAKGRTNEH